MWAQIINAILGIWLMVSPAILASDKTVANNDHIIGPLIAAFAVISWWEATRVVRLYNLLPAAWLLLAPWVLGYSDTTAILNDMAVGLLVIILCFVKGKVDARFGGGWSAIWGKDPIHAQEAARQPRV
ncbi:SPW repeat protein [Pontibacter sp. 172403-2]|uniref:SPW repeat domain-containing protein n=1 Tax=Pontibacter rufus TaxID=2791028 RepID=UPI0018AF766C|nr:SPW repeat protein [Pontibacter sp. 172403-2]MBF9253969.1 SPW repeat protein [Pontibacter sp. 172403-2]